MEPTRRGVLAAGAALGLGLATQTRAAAPVRGVVELFTSQGCSSCPPADRLLGQLAQDPSLIVLSLPVDYWDGLGWKDTLARPEFTRRQRAYAQSRGDGEIYTPQVVVNGRDHAVGSDRTAILALLEAPLPVSVAIANGAEGMVATVEGAAPDAVLILAPFVRSREVAIGRGENARLKVTYTNVVRGLTVLGSVSGATRFRLDMPAGAEGLAVLVQHGGLDHPGRIVGAART